MTDKEFVDGLIVKAPAGNAPDFLKCRLFIKRKELGNWLREKEDEWINVDVKVSQKGAWYCEVNNWKPSGKQEAVKPAAKYDDFNDDLGF